MMMSFVSPSISTFFFLSTTVLPSKSVVFNLMLNSLDSTSKVYSTSVRVSTFLPSSSASIVRLPSVSVFICSAALLMSCVLSSCMQRLPSMRYWQCWRSLVYSDKHTPKNLSACWLQYDSLSDSSMSTASGKLSRIYVNAALVFSASV